MKIHEYWRATYRRNRYLECFDQEKIEQRTRDICANLVRLNDKGQLSPVTEMTGDSDRWIILFTHILEEMALRCGDFRPGFMEQTFLPKASWPNAPRAVTAINKRQFEIEKCLFKFGKEKYLRPAIAEGKIRFAPASSYSDSSLNYAIRDDELKFTIESPAAGMYFQKLDKVTLQPVGEKIPIQGVFQQSRELLSDFLVFCLTTKYEYRALDDFEADCCLVIKDINSFNRRLMKALVELKPGWRVLIDTVDYLDPINSKPENVRPFFAKHFRYAYQNEIRIVCVPPEPVSKLEPVYVNLGPLEDIAEIVCAPV